MRNIVKSILPPILTRLYYSRIGNWKGDFKSWDEAVAQSKGYDQREILAKVEKSTLAVINGEYKYERDSVLFDKVEYSWPLVSALLWTHIKFNSLHVLDFGGSLGSTYNQNKMFTQDLKAASWTVVEQDSFVEVGRDKFTTQELSFQNTIEGAFKNQPINFVLLSGVLQYIADPYVVLEELIKRDPRVIFIDRLSVVDSDRDIVTVQNVPKEIYEASYPCRFFVESNIRSILGAKYDLVSSFPSYIRNEGFLSGGRKHQDIGQFWIRK